MRSTGTLLVAAAAAFHLVQAVPHRWQLPFLGGGSSGSSDDGFIKAVPITNAQFDHGLWRSQHTTGLPPHVPSLESLAATLDEDHFAQLISHIAALPERRTIALSERPEDVYTVSEGMKAVLVYAGIKFMDITDHPGTEANTVPVAVRVAGDDSGSGSGKHGHGHGDAEPLPSKIKYGVKDLEKRFYKDIDTKRMKAFLTKFSSFRTRWATKQSPVCICVAITADPGRTRRRLQILPQLDGQGVAGMASQPGQRGALVSQATIPAQDRPLTPKTACLPGLGCTRPH